ncbi:hypothetical protein O0L34_g9059 [Tuta absoluta]|nr:hypothetical protein O0L34_g9059 [Tuta absoluta]
MKPEARLSSATSWEDHGNAWSAAMGAVFGAGTVLIIAALLLLWKRPRKREIPTLAPLDVGHNVSAISIPKVCVEFSHRCSIWCHCCYAVDVEATEETGDSYLGAS